MRPIPTNYAILAASQQMSVLLEQASDFAQTQFLFQSLHSLVFPSSQAASLKVIEHPNRWRLVYLDFPDKMPTNISSEITIFKPTSQMCCVFSGRSADAKCECGQTMMASEMLNSLFLAF